MKQLAVMVVLTIVLFARLNMSRIKNSKLKQFLIPDSAIPDLFFLASGRKMTGYDMCTNFYRRFFEVCLVYCAEEFRRVGDKQ